MKTREFFEKRLRAPLVNQGWSWGSVDRENRRVYLRIHEEDVQPDAWTPKRVMLLSSSWSASESHGRAERIEHIELMRQGWSGFGVTYTTFWGGNRWKTKDFERRFLLRLGKMHTKGADISATVVERLPVEEVVDSSAHNAIEAEIDELVACDAPITDRQALIRARIGQGEFRSQVLRLWSYRCAVTGCGIQDVIRASHIKTWRDSSDRERLDPYNGLPLVATLDALFDKHLIAFDARGKMLVSSELAKEERDLLLPVKARLLRPPASRTASYLQAHAAMLR